MQIDKCNGCGKQMRISNKHYMLCAPCNHKRLQKGKTKSKLEAEKRAKQKQAVKRAEIMGRDREVYREVFDSCFTHKCEECGKPLPTEFETEDGIMLTPSRYSHILPKSTYPEFRHDVRNFNNLCIDCHQIWEFGDKTKMVIYEKNTKTIDELIHERNTANKRGK